MVLGLTALRLAPPYEGQTSGTIWTRKSLQAAHLSRPDTRERKGMALFIIVLKASSQSSSFVWIHTDTSLIQTSWRGCLSCQMKGEGWWNGRKWRLKSWRLSSRPKTAATWPWSGILTFLGFCWTVCRMSYWCLPHWAVMKIGQDGGLVRAGSQAFAILVFPGCRPSKGEAYMHRVYYLLHTENHTFVDIQINLWFVPVFFSVNSRTNKRNRLC